MSATKKKATGAHFTPPELARHVAKRLADLIASIEGPIRVLDPACGDGNLLRAMAEVLPKKIQRRVTLIGIENDDASFTALTSGTNQFGACAADLIKGDFLEFFEDGDLFGAPQELAPVDVIVANPPYVRTQVLGAKRSKDLANRFGLSGRVDLYQAFLVAMAKRLRPGGILGVITSNRFLTTKGGMATRRFLRANFELIEIVDLGDTKLFEAAVLPALVFARKCRKTPLAKPHPKFVRIYEYRDCDASCAESAQSVLDCLDSSTSGLFQTNGITYRVARGELSIPNDDTRSWTMLTDYEGRFIARLDAVSKCRLGDVAKVRVGIKTTADDVYVRRDWHTLPDALRSEEKYLRPLLSQENAAKWRPRDSDDCQKRVLYTHEVVEGCRRAIAFDKSSPTWQYLLAHKEKLESRKYVIDAGRSWYEIWVPQDPSAWNRPKIVFPDISPEPRFFLDRKGHIVDGNCYWITTYDPLDEDLLLLILGVANSSLMTRYHDLAFQNKLYSQRRRHLTQYVVEYPLPDRRIPASIEIVELARQLSAGTTTRDDQLSLELRLDGLVPLAFGIDSSEFTDMKG